MGSRSPALVIVVVPTLGFATLPVWDPVGLQAPRLAVFDTYRRIKPRPHIDPPETVNRPPLAVGAGLIY